MLLVWCVILTAGCLAPEEVAGDPDPRIQVADSLYEVGEVRYAYDTLVDLLEEEPGSYEALWRAASLAVALGVGAEGERNGDAGAPWYQRAEEMTSRALDVRPEGVEARYWKVATMGRRALQAGPLEAIGLAERIREGSLEILEQEPSHPGAHNALGRLYYEVMALSGVARFMARALPGGGGVAMEEASWELAEEYLRRAVELDPASSLYRLDLGRLLIRQGHREEAGRELRRVVEESGRHPAEGSFVEEARKLLAQLGQ